MLHVLSFDNGRTDRASLQRVTRLDRPSPLKVTVLHVLSFDNGRTSRESLQRVTRLVVTRIVLLKLQNLTSNILISNF